MDRSRPVNFQHPQGFLSLAKNVGIKDRTLDLTVIYSTVRARAVAMFTQSRFPGAPVIVGREHVADGFVQAPMRPMLRRVVDRTFNSMSIDTDTSTSDTVVLMANGLGGPVSLRRFEEELLGVREYLTREIARNGEGATKLITVDVNGAKTKVQAKRVAKSVVNSPLLKTAVYGCDPNWGRVIMAVGKCFDKNIEPAKVTIQFGDTKVFRRGAPVDCDLEALRRYLGQLEVMIGVDLDIGKASAPVWGCDLTEGYIKANAYYTT